jgi:hypothetical protein
MNKDILVAVDLRTDDCSRQLVLVVAIEVPLLQSKLLLFVWQSPVTTHHLASFPTPPTPPPQVFDGKRGL